MSAVLWFTLAVTLVSGTAADHQATLVFFVAGLFVLWVSRRVPAFERLRPLARVADIVATNVALTLVLLEVTLSIYAAVSENVLLARDNISAYRFLPNHDYGRLWTNSLGYPSREFVRARRQGIFRVVLLGDSFAAGSVRQDVNFASGIERLLPDVEIYNFGLSSLGPRDYRIILETEALSFNPDVVLVAIFVGNDLTDVPVDAGLSFDDPTLARFSKRSWRLLREWYRQVTGATPSPLLLPQLSTPVIPEKGFNLSRQTYIEVEVERLGLSRLSLREAHEEALTNALAELRAMRDECRRRGIVFAMAIIPDEFQVNPDLLEELLRIGAVPREDVDLDLPQRRLLDFCRTENIACLDLLPVLAGRRDVYLPQDTHWNETGNLLAAEALAPWLDGLRDGPRDAGELGVVDDRPPLMAR